MKNRVAGLMVIGLLVGACGAGGDLAFDDVWARQSASTQDAGAVYMTISGGDDADQLLGVSVPADVAASAEVHETSMVDDADESGMMMMQQVDSIDVPADGEVKLEPGGYHIMLMKLASSLETGQEFSITLQFRDAGEIVVAATVEDR